MFSSVKKTFSSFLTQNKRSFASTRRKYPINSEKNTLPVFDYGASKSRRRVFVWGNIQTGALGLPYLKQNDKIDRVDSIKCPQRSTFGEKFSVTTAACGFGFTVFAVKSDDNKKLYGTGLNTDSQIGHHVIRAKHPLGILFLPQPIPLPFKNPEKSEIRKLSAGRSHLAALTDEGLFLFGNNSYGQCGRDIVTDEDYTLNHYINHVVDIDGKKIIYVECGQDHTLAITEDGSVYSCGWGADGQTGLGHFDNCGKFTKLRGDIEGEKIVKVASRSDFVLAINDKGDAFGWGNAEYGQITTSTREQQVCNPTHLKHLQKLGPAKDVSAGGSSCMVLTERGDVFVWGYGILGVGPQVGQSFIPIKLPPTLFGRNDYQPNSRVVGIKCGLSYSVAWTNLGDIYAWGRNSKCCLGLGHNKDQFFPLKVSLGGCVREISCGVDHTVAICKPFI